MVAPGIEAGIRITIACMRCRISLLSLASAGRKPVDHEPQSSALPPWGSLLAFCLPGFFFRPFLGHCASLGGDFSPRPPSLQAWVLPFLDVDVPELCSTLRAFVISFSCGIFAVRLPGMPSVASAHSVSTWSRALPLGIGHVLQDVSGGLRVLFNAMLAPLMLAMVLWSSLEKRIHHFIPSSAFHFLSPRAIGSVYALVPSFLRWTFPPSPGTQTLNREARVNLFWPSPHFPDHLAPWAAFQGAMEETTVI